VVACERVNLPLFRHKALFTTTQILTLAVELRELHDLGEIGIEESLLLTLYVGERLLCAPLPDLDVLGEPRTPSSPRQRRRDLSRIAQHLTEVLPDHLIEDASRDVGRRAALLLAPPAGVIRIAVVGEPGHGSPVTLTTTHQRA